jgi:hypothetical protein
MHACIDVCMCVCMYVCMYACIYVCMCVCMCTCMSVHMYVCAGEERYASPMSTGLLPQAHAGAWAWVAGRCAWEESGSSVYTSTPLPSLLTHARGRVSWQGVVQRYQAEVRKLKGQGVASTPPSHTHAHHASYGHNGGSNSNGSGNQMS